MDMNLSADDCLKILQATDTDRVWRSLDDKRVCLRCKNTITGHEIVITRDKPGRFGLHCPTPDCTSTIEDWLYLTHVSSDPDRKPPAVIRRVEMDFVNW
jgi:hypothetical protein